MFQEESQPFVIFYFKIYIYCFFFCRYVAKRSLPLSNFVMQLGALLVVFIICMVLVLAIKDGEADLRTVLQVYIIFLLSRSIQFLFLAYIYLSLCRFYCMDDMVYLGYN
jgi:hypothetical protein